MSVLPTVLINNIIDYLPYHKQININKKYNDKITKFYKYHVNKIQYFYKISIDRICQTMIEDSYLVNTKDLQTYYILYYPDEYKEEYMRLTLSQVNNNANKYEKLYSIYSNHNISVDKKFIRFIRHLTVYELAYVGW
jgi:glycerophosphoryl diester phosphodiesterase